MGCHHAIARPYGAGALNLSSGPLRGIRQRAGVLPTSEVGSVGCRQNPAAAIAARAVPSGWPEFATAVIGRPDTSRHAARTGARSECHRRPPGSSSPCRRRSRDWICGTGTTRRKPHCSIPLDAGDRVISGTSGFPWVVQAAGPDIVVAVEVLQGSARPLARNRRRPT